MTASVTPPGTRGARFPRLPGWLMGLMSAISKAGFRRSGGRVHVAGRPVVLLTTVGAKSGRERQSVLGWWPDEAAGDGSVLVVGSLAGAARHPGWVYNLAAHPDRVWLERHGVRVQVRPETLSGAERAAAWAMIAAGSAQYAGYQEKTDRELPVIRLRPA